jgi:hypothetical protein
MNLTTTRSIFRNPFQTLAKSRIRSGAVYGTIILLAMVAFEAFNYGTTAYALRDLLGDLRFAGIQWATLMALAFCGLDFAGIARLINQSGRKENPKESWYLFGAWLIAATFNAALTWWGVSIAISGHTLRSAEVVNTKTLITVVPVLVAIMVWVIRILIIGSLSSALDRISASKRTPATSRSTISPSAITPIRSNRPTSAYSHSIPSNRPSNSVAAQARPEPTYHKFSSASSNTAQTSIPAGNDRPTRKF